MKSTHLFKVLLTISITNGYIYSMVRIPASVNNAVMAQILNISKHMPYLNSQIANQAQIVPQITLTQHQIATLASSIAQEIEPSSTAYGNFKPFTGVRPVSTGMFKPTAIKLITWNHKENPYNVLEINSRNVTEIELKAAYKKMAMKHHPDRGGKKEDFLKTQDAYQYLIQQLKTGKTDSTDNNASQAHTHSYKRNKSHQHNSSNQNNNYQEKTGKIDPQEQAPEGNWTFVGSWKKATITQSIFDSWKNTMITQSILGTNNQAWQRILQDEDGFYWTETAIHHGVEIKVDKHCNIKYSPEKFEYNAKPDMGWEQYNQFYIKHGYAQLDEAKLKQLLVSSGNPFEIIFQKYFIKIFPTVLLIPSIKKEIYDGACKILENHFELLNMGRSKAKKFDPCKINRSPEETKELEDATKRMKEALYTLYPNLKTSLDAYFKSIEKIEKINTSINKLEGTNVSFNVNTATHIQQFIDTQVSMFGINTTIDTIGATIVQLRNFLLFLMGYTTIKFVQRKLTPSEKITTEHSTDPIVENKETKEEVIKFEDINLKTSMN